MSIFTNYFLKTFLFFVVVFCCGVFFSFFFLVFKVDDSFMKFYIDKKHKSDIVQLGIEILAHY